MASKAGLAGPEQPGEIQRPTFTEWMDVCPDPYLRKYAWHGRRQAKLRREDLVEQGLSLVLVGLLGQGKLADEDLPRLGEHAFLPG